MFCRVSALAQRHGATHGSPYAQRRFCTVSDGQRQKVGSKWREAFHLQGQAPRVLVIVVFILLYQAHAFVKPAQWSAEEVSAHWCSDAVVLEHYTRVGRTCVASERPQPFQSCHTSQCSWCWPVSLQQTMKFTTFVLPVSCTESEEAKCPFISKELRVRQLLSRPLSRICAVYYCACLGTISDRCTGDAHRSPYCNDRIYRAAVDDYLNHHDFNDQHNYHFNSTPAHFGLLSVSPDECSANPILLCRFLATTAVFQTGPHTHDVDMPAMT